MRRFSSKLSLLPSLPIAALCLATCCSAGAQVAGEPAQAHPPVPAWAEPGSATHQQVPPPAGFHRPSRNLEKPIGIFDGQSDVGAALVPGSATYDESSRQYTIRSAGYNIWYTRDEFRFVWKKMTGDLSLAADASFLDPKGYDDRKVVLVIRQSLEDDAKEAMIGEHGGGLIHLAQRRNRGAMMTDIQHRFQTLPQRIGIEKHGDAITIFVSMKGEPMHPLGSAIQLHFAEPFYVGLGFCSHLPVTVDTAILSHVVLERSAGRVH